jgi:hypothetical protein
VTLVKDEGAESAELSLYDFRVSTMSWGNIFDLRVVATSREQARLIVEAKYENWRVQEMDGVVKLKVGVIL